MDSYDSFDEDDMSVVGKCIDAIMAVWRSFMQWLKDVAPISRREAREMLSRAVKYELRPSQRIVSANSVEIKSLIEDQKKLRYDMDALFSSFHKVQTDRRVPDILDMIRKLEDSVTRVISEAGHLKKRLADLEQSAKPKKATKKKVAK